MTKSNQPNTTNEKDAFTLYYFTGIYHLFEGRVIGYIDDKQFAAILANAKILSRKLSTMPPMDFFDITDDEAVGLRLAFLTKDNKGNRHLVLSGKIRDINSSLAYGMGAIAYTDENNNMFCLNVEVK